VQIAPASSTIPTAPTGLIATVVSGSEINLTWTAPSGTVTGYNVYRGTASGGESTTPVATGLAVASYADMNVTAGTTYYYTVAAANSAGTGPASAEASAVVPTAPSAPTGLTAVAKSSTEIDLSWTAASGSVSSYGVFRGTSPGGESATPVASGLTGVTYADTSVVAGTKYYYEVSAVNLAGAGPYSNEASATALQPSLAIAPATGSSTSATVTPGQTATFQLVLTTTNYSGTITFACTGAPAGDTCSAPSPVTVTPATGPTAVSVSVQTGASASITNLLAHGLLALAAGFLILPIRLRANRRAMIAMALAAFTMLGAANGCGSGSSGGNSGNSTTPVVSTLTVSASGPGVATVTQALTLTVQ